MSKITPELVFAICITESSLNPWATRYEPNWRWGATPLKFSKKLGITEDTERVQQATSWGLMQVMGTVARELGFLKELPRLCDPVLSLTYGIKKLKTIEKRYPNHLDEIIAAYNAGSPRRELKKNRFVNQDYVDKVFKNLERVDKNLEYYIAAYKLLNSP